MGLELVVDDRAAGFIADVGYDPQFGARPLKRAIQRYVEDPVSEALLGRRISSGRVTVTVDPSGDTTVVA